MEDLVSGAARAGETERCAAVVVSAGGFAFLMVGTVRICSRSAECTRVRRCTDSVTLDVRVVSEVDDAELCLMLPAAQ